MTDSNRSPASPGERCQPAGDRAPAPPAGGQAKTTATIMLANGDVLQLGWDADTVTLLHTGARNVIQTVVSWQEWRAIVAAVPKLPPLIHPVARLDQ